MFDRLIAYWSAARQNRRLADEFASMNHRDFADIGIDRADVPHLLAENFDRLFAEALSRRTLARTYARRSPA